MPKKIKDAETGLKYILDNIESPHPKLIDVGCGNLDTLKKIKKKYSYEMYGCDIQNPNETLDNLVFKTVNLEKDPIPFDNNFFDLTISSHVIEHLRNPLEHFSELVRVTSENGYIILVAPSDKSTLFSFPHSQGKNLILSYYDDPTHIGRPWTPQSLYRLGLYHNLEVKLSKYEFSLKEAIMLPLSFLEWMKKNNTDEFIDKYWKATGWVVFAIFKKVKDSSSNMNYYSLKNKASNKVDWEWIA